MKGRGHEDNSMSQAMTQSVPRFKGGPYHTV